MAPLPADLAWCHSPPSRIPTYPNPTLQVADPAAWRPFLAGGKLRLRLTLQGSSVE